MNNHQVGVESKEFGMYNRSISNINSILALSTSHHVITEHDRWSALFFGLFCSQLVATALLILDRHFWIVIMVHECHSLAMGWRGILRRGLLNANDVSTNCSGHSIFWPQEDAFPWLPPGGSFSPSCPSVKTSTQADNSSSSPIPITEMSEIRYIYNPPPYSIEPADLRPSKFNWMQSCGCLVNPSRIIKGHWDGSRLFGYGCQTTNKRSKSYFNTVEIEAAKYP
jgi:hypothetical protein